MLTCPCHTVPLLLIIGSTAAGVWMAQHFTFVVIGFAALFVLSLWLLFRPKFSKAARECSSCKITPGRAL